MPFTEIPGSSLRVDLFLLYRSQNTKRPELRFYALLTDGAREVRLEGIRNYQERIEEMEKDRDALLESYALRAPEALNELTPEERHHVYRMLRLRAAVRIGGAIEVSGMFGEGSGFCHPEVRSSTQ